MAATSGQLTRTRGIRYRADVGFEAKCDDCAARHDGSAWYWPLTLEFWNPERGMVRCRSCFLAYDRRKERARRMAMGAEGRRARDRERYRLNRKWLLIKRAEYHERNRERILAAQRVRYYAKKAAA